MTTIKQYLIVQQEGGREVERSVEHYSLDAIIAVGYRVRSERGLRFRQWATFQLRELLTKGFVMDDERIKGGRTGSSDYFDELLERIRAIRASERIHYAVHGKTAAEVIRERADSATGPRSCRAK